MLKKVIKTILSPCLYPDHTKRIQGLFWAKTHPQSKFSWNPLGAFCKKYKKQDLYTLDDAPINNYYLKKKPQFVHFASRRFLLIQN